MTYSVNILLQEAKEGFLAHVTMLPSFLHIWSWQTHWMPWYTKAKDVPIPWDNYINYNKGKKNSFYLQREWPLHVDPWTTGGLRTGCAEGCRSDFRCVTLQATGSYVLAVQKLKFLCQGGWKKVITWPRIQAHTDGLCSGPADVFWMSSHSHQPTPNPQPEQL